jgi:hypothetical protein
MKIKAFLAAAVLAFLAISPTRAAGPSCYSGSAPGTPRALGANRDRLIADLARRKSTDACELWSALNKAERYVFLMDTAYLADKSSRLYPPGVNKETALDHATALYSINGPKAGQGIDKSGRGGEDYNRIYLGFDALASCVMRDAAEANPHRDPDYNSWRKSDDGKGPHKPFNAREMIVWSSWTDDDMRNSLGPQFHHWSRDADLDRGGIDKRLGVCGVSDPSLTEATVAFDFYHNSDPLGDYAGRGGYGWEIVDKHVAGGGAWGYTPAGCAPTLPVNEDMTGGGTFNGLGTVMEGGACAAAPIAIPPAPARLTAEGAARVERSLESLTRDAGL